MTPKSMSSRSDITPERCRQPLNNRRDEPRRFPKTCKDEEHRHLVTSVMARTFPKRRVMILFIPYTGYCVYHPWRIMQMRSEVQETKKPTRVVSLQVERANHTVPSSGTHVASRARDLANRLTNFPIRTIISGENAKKRPAWIRACGNPSGGRHREKKRKKAKRLVPTWARRASATD